VSVVIGEMLIKSSSLQLLYRQMLLIRRAEERLQKLFADGDVPGFLHLSIGQEAVAVGISSVLGVADTVSSNHRGHGHALAKGVALSGFFAEILGRADGVCRGRGGSMHVADLSIGMLGANGIVGAGMPITTGSALALKMKGAGNIAAVYFGDGALAEGVIHECFNLTSLWDLPVLFVCENNGWSEFSPTERQLATSLERLSASFGIAFSSVDGNDVVAVADQAGKFVNEMRDMPSPRVIECQTTRIRGHFEGDPQDYRDKEEMSMMSERDPIARARSQLLTEGLSDLWFEQLHAEVDSEIDVALNLAKRSPEPTSDSLVADVYTPRLGVS
jgi:TPP-dependent pyruvate/acetoin dehydrogenase alpha subunit